MLIALLWCPGLTLVAAVGTCGCRSSRDLRFACRRAAALHPCPWGLQHRGEVQRLGFCLAPLPSAF